MNQQRKAVILLSGGLDSATVMAIAKAEGYELYALTFQYGQRHAIEIEAARRIAAALGAKKHLILDLDLRIIGGSALTGPLDVPKKDSLGDGEEAGIPVTYVPARNTIFLSYALAWAEVLEIAEIFIGVNAVDYSGYPDCRPEYIAAYEAMANLATKACTEGKMRLQIRTPLLMLSKADIIRKGIALGVDYGMTTTCYDPLPDGRACGRCDSCHLRRKGFQEAGFEDPAFSGR